MAAPQFKAVLIATPQMRSESGLTFRSKQSAVWPADPCGRRGCREPAGKTCYLPRFHIMLSSASPSEKSLRSKKGRRTFTHKPAGGVLQGAALPRLLAHGLEHFLYIAEAMPDMGGRGVGLWHEQDGFYYDDVLNLSTGQTVPLQARSMVGLVPLFAVETLDPGTLRKVP